ncbi:MAG TPA: ABC transporter substrate-binding protein [Mycobacteriales bacterium]|nr:ABC transporter substrate-binding protein [Mycobacteriales bacterium]
MPRPPTYAARTSGRGLQTTSRLAAFLLAATVAMTGCTGTAHRAAARTGDSPTATTTSVPSHPAAPSPRPVRGGTLRVVDAGIDYLDPNVSYYSLGYSLLRLVSRQLYSWPADPAAATTVVPDLATGPPSVDPTRTVYTVTIRADARWGTSPPRQVTAADVVRGVEITCNPAEPFGGLTDFESLIEGMTSFCAAFARVRPRPLPIRAFLDDHALPGVHVGADRRQVVFELTRPVNYFPELLALPAFSPRPREMLAQLPGGSRGVSHPISDGPYRLASQTPSTYGAPAQMTFARNPAWNGSSDPIRGGYVDTIRVNFRAGGYPEHRMARLLASGAADLCLCDLGPPDADRLIRDHDPRISVHPRSATNPYLVFNTVSPNGDGALRNPDVRRAISYALDRSAFTAALGGQQLAPPLTHVLPDGVLGSQPSDPYPHDPSRASDLLSRSGVHRLVLWGYFPFSSPTAQRIFRAARSQLAAVGIRLRARVSELDFYGNELRRPQSTRRGYWDIALVGWFPDWQGNAAESFFRPLFDGRVLPPTSSDFGLYDDPEVDRLIDEAGRADLASAAQLWRQADQLVMRDAAMYPIAQQNLAMWCGHRVRHCVDVPALDGVDLTNVWRAHA